VKTPAQTGFGADSSRTSGAFPERLAASGGQWRNPRLSREMSAGPPEPPTRPGGPGRVLVDARWTPSCTVAGCERPRVVYVPVMVGGEPVASGWCGPHAAEYRVDEVTA
jgi:hypothetical protein